MSIKTLKIPLGDTYIKQGDTIPKITFTFDPTDNIDLSAPGVEIKMQIYNGLGKFIDYSVGSGITIISSKVFEINEVNKENNTYPHGTFKGDLEITDGDGKRFTYFNVDYTVIKQYTI